jgi:TfoX/Sxy family transcriptional regulator of competence genes
MAFDVDLANRIRELLGTERGVQEMSMFGGLAFLVGGHMAVAVSGNGLLARVAPADTDRLLAKKHVGPMVMAGRETRGWLRVDGAGVKTDRQLAEWVRRGVDYVRGLPPK